MKRWPTVPLGEVMSLQIEAVPTTALGSINLAGVSGFGRGLFRRGPTNPMETTYKAFHRLSAGDFVISSPKAWEGAVARISEEFDGWFLSPVFPTFRADGTRLDTRYLEWYCKRQQVWRQLQGKAKGMGARRESVSPEQFLSLEVPLPSLPEQQALVSTLDALADKVGKLDVALTAIERDADQLLITLATRNDLSDIERKDRGWRAGRLGDILIAAAAPVRVVADESYPNVGVLNFARGLFSKPPINGSSTSAATLYQIRAQQLIYSRLFAFEGAYAVVEEEHDGAFVSNEFPTFDIDRERASPAFLYAYFRSPGVWETIAHGSKGLGDRRQRVQPAQLLDHKLWLPPANVLQQLSSAVPAIVEIKRRHAAMREANGSLVSAALESVFAEIGKSDDEPRD